MSVDAGELRALLESGVRDGVFPGAVAAVVDVGGASTPLAVGLRMVVPERRPMRADTLFDVASITKPVATASAILSLADSGDLSLEDPVSDYLPEFARGDVTLSQLLTHTSGLPAWRALYLDPGDPARVVDYLGRLAPEYPIGTRIVYSCLGYIVLRYVVKTVIGRDLDVFASERLFRPLGMEDTLFSPPQALHDSCAATEDYSQTERKMTEDADYTWRTGVVCGEVHDENARLLDGIGGNAGLFSTAGDLALFAQCLLRGGAPIFSPDIFERISRVAAQDPDTQRTIAWVKGDDGSLMHSGFTGTAMRWHPERGRAAILLTNRIHPVAGDAAPIRAFREMFLRAAIG